MATHSSVLAWRIPGTGEPGGLPSVGSHRVGHDGSDLAAAAAAGFPGGASGKELACQCRRHERHGFDPWVRKIPWRREWQSTSVFLPRKCYGQRSLVDYSPWGHRELDMTWQLSPHGHTDYCIGIVLVNNCRIRAVLASSVFYAGIHSRRSNNLLYVV